jgi:hypothetical protein
MTTATRPTAEPFRSAAPPPRCWGGRLLVAAVAAGLAGYLLFCHGCHGDDDNELFAAGPSAAQWGGTCMGTGWAKH